MENGDGNVNSNLICKLGLCIQVKQRKRCVPLYQILNRLRRNFNVVEHLGAEDVLIFSQSDGGRLGGNGRHPWAEC